MLTFSRRRFAACVPPAVSGLLSANIGRAAERGRVHRLGLHLPVTDPTTVWMRIAADRIKAESDGRLEILVSPHGLPTLANETLSDLRSGKLDFMLVASPALSQSIPAAAISSVAFAFGEDQAAYRALDGELGTLVRSRIAAAGVTALGRIWGSGFQQVTTDTIPIRTATDLAGLRIAVAGDSGLPDVMEALKARPTKIVDGQLYPALRDRAIDGQAGPLTAIVADRLYEVQRHLSLTNHVWSCCWLLANRESLEALPGDLREVVAKVFDDCALEQRVALERATSAGIRALIDKGMSVNQPEADGFRAVLSRTNYYRKVRASFDDRLWAALKKVAPNVD